MSASVSQQRWNGEIELVREDWYLLLEGYGMGLREGKMYVTRCQDMVCNDGEDDDDDDDVWYICR